MPNGGDDGGADPQTRFAPVRRVDDDDFEVLADGTVVGRIFKANAAPVGALWVWTLAFGAPRGPPRAVSAIHH
jgi:hypothetical protein